MKRTLSNRNCCCHPHRYHRNYTESHTKGRIILKSPSREPQISHCRLSYMSMLTLASKIGMLESPCPKPFISHNKVAKKVHTVTSKSVSSGSSGATKVMGPSNGGSGASLNRRWYPSAKRNAHKHIM